MLETKYKEHVRSHIADVLSAIDTLKKVVRDATEVETQTRRGLPKSPAFSNL